MTDYIYHGPTQSLSLATGTKKKDGETVSVFEDFTLIEGAPVSLPERSVVVQNMFAVDMLTLPDASSKPAAKTTTTPEGGK